MIIDRIRFSLALITKSMLKEVGADASSKNPLRAVLKKNCQKKHAYFLLDPERVLGGSTTRPDFQIRKTSKLVLKREKTKLVKKSN